VTGFPVGKEFNFFVSIVYEDLFLWQ